MRRRPTPTWLPLAALIALLLLAYALRSALGIEWNAQSIRDVVAGYGVWGPIVFFCLIAFRSLLLVPSQIALVAGGVAFGTVEGALYGAIGLLGSGTLAYALTRWVLRDAVLERIPPRLRGVLEAADSRTGGFLIFLGTAYPIGPLTAYHAGAALTGIGLLGFVFWLALGATVRAFTYTYFGDALVAGDPATLLGATAIVLLVGTLPLLHPRAREWVKTQFEMVRDGARDAAGDTDRRD